MTVADKLRELLATRPAFPGILELFRWWQTSGLLVPQVLDDLEGVDRDLVAERAAHRRTLDARAELRIELDRAREQHKAELAELARVSGVLTFHSALAAGRAAVASILQVEVDDEDRCAVCGGPLFASTVAGCVRGNCSYRPRPTNLYAPARAEREAADRKEAWHG